MVDVVANDIFP